MSEPSSHSMIVIGAGLAGLYAASLLHSEFPDLLVLEATDRPGGRVRQVEGVAPWPVEAGPQFIHGAHSSLQELLGEIDCSIHEYDWPDNWYFGRERRLFRATVEDADLQNTHNLFAEVGQERYPAKDISAEDWLRNKGATAQMLAIADACYANDFGCSIQQLGLKEMITENRNWHSGDSYLVLDQDLSCLVKHIAKDLHHNILCNCPVTKVVHDAEGAVLTAAGRHFKAQHVLVTVPITVLQREEIIFAPPQPLAKQEAIKRIKMSNAVKVIMLFEQPFWPPDFFDVICTDCFIPEFWVTKPPMHPSPHSHSRPTSVKQQHTVTGHPSPGRPNSTLECNDKQGSQIRQEPCLQPSTEQQTLLQADAQKEVLQAQQEGQQQQAQGHLNQAQQQTQHEQTEQQSQQVTQSQQQQQPQQTPSEQQQSEDQHLHADQQQQPGQQHGSPVVQDVHCMVGFAAGSRAVEMSKMSQTAVIMNTLAQLDTMFGTSKQRHPATFNFVRAHVVDWSQEKYMYGAYTYPSLHAEVGDRDVLAEPLGTTVFFAGEATHAAINPCMQAAMETGQRAAKQILALHKKGDDSKL